MDERWGVLQQEKEKGQAITYVFEQGNKRIVYPFIKRTAGIVDGEQYYDLLTPRGQCGMWIENCDIPYRSEFICAFNDEFKEYCIQEHIVAEYIRFSPWINQANEFASIYDIRFHAFTYCNDLTRDFFNVEYSSKKRYDIRKAEKSGIEIVLDTSSSSIDDVLRIYAFTVSKYDVSNYYIIDKYFVERYCDMFPNDIVFARAMYKGEVVSAAIILMGEDIAHYQFAGSNPEYISLRGNSLLIYKASLYAGKKGKRLFDLGVSKVGSNVARFKQAFVNKSKAYPIHVGTKIRNHEIYDAIVEQSGGPRDSYFPAYRR